MRTSRLYCFADAAAWAAALAAQGWQDGTPPGVDLLVSSDLREPSDDPEQLGAEISGVFVHGLFLSTPPPAWEACRISPAQAPAAMARWPGTEPTMADYQAAIDGLVQSTARTRNYNDAASCASYVSSGVAGWRAEAEAFVAWRDQVYLETFETLAAVQAGAPAPSVEEFVGSLPAIEWPA